jgi:hypothetical protein
MCQNCGFKPFKNMRQPTQQQGISGLLKQYFSFFGISFGEERAGPEA